MVLQLETCLLRYSLPCLLIEECLCLSVSVRKCICSPLFLEWDGSLENSSVARYLDGCSFGIIFCS